jgi:hypothetical protein
MPLSVSAFARSSLVLIAFADSPRAIAEAGNAAWRDLAVCGLVATR